jgi:hypothetical protein
MGAMNINTANLNRVILEKMPAELLLYNMSQASNYWGISDDVIPKRKRGVFSEVGQYLNYTKSVVNSTIDCLFIIRELSTKREQKLVLSR